jgi:hypothetical protein
MMYHKALPLAECNLNQTLQILFIRDTPETDILMPKKLGFQVLYLDGSADRPATPIPDGIPTITHWDQFCP